MNIQIVIFDVDGTLIDGNCTYIFMRYLFEKKIIKPTDFTIFNNKFNKYGKNDIHYAEIIKESIQTLSDLGIRKLKNHWKQCFDERVKMKFRKNIVNQLKEFQHKNLEIALASGSHKELISLIGQELDIKSENIIATESGILNQRSASITSESICYGDIKMKRVSDFLNSKDIDLNHVLFFTDNVSDLSLLSAVGKGCWVGSYEAYSEYSMAKKGIEDFNVRITTSDLCSKKELKLNKSLQNYYNKNKTVIEQSISEILPDKCTVESMDHLVGKIEFRWDLNMLQRSFFNPAYKYIHKNKEKIISLGSCLLMEAGDIDIHKFIPLIGIGDILETSAEMFLDIKEWTREEHIQFWNKSTTDNAIIGNVSIALISLVTNNLIFNRILVDDERKSALYEGLTSVIFYTLFGNGLKLFWEQQNEIRITAKEYDKVAFFTNMSPLQIPFDLWRILRKEKPSKTETDTLNSFIENISVAIQLKKDVTSFDLWQKHLPQSKTNKFGLFTNFLNIYAVHYFDDPFIFSDNPSVESVLEVITKADSKSYTLQKSDDFKREAFYLLDELPIKRNYREMIKQYSTYLMHRS